MKKLILSFSGIFIFCDFVKAGLPEWNYTPISSHTEVATDGVMMFTSATIRWVGVTVSSPAPNSYLAFWRSTSSAMTTDIATQTLINTAYDFLQSPVFIPMFDILNSSYTFFNKVGTAKVTLWLRCLGGESPNNGLCPGLKDSGQR